MTHASLRSALQAGPVLGTWSLIPSPTVHEILGIGGFDFAILDMEHGPYGLPDIEAGVRACNVTGCRVLVRVPTIDGPLIQTVLDTGAEGIVVPKVRSADDARSVVAATRFPPHGIRGFNPFTRANGHDPSKKMVNTEPFTCVIVEDRDACTETTLADILTVHGLDAIYVGAYDLSVALGRPGEVTHPDVTSVIERCVNQIAAAGKTAGMMVRSEDSLKNAIALGAKMLLWSVDTDIVRSAVENPVAMLRGIAPQA